jgi:nucleotide-binding universal stress UspA family protein
MTTQTVGPVVVGVDGSSASERALVWAAAAASQRHVALDVVHAWTMPIFGAVPDPVVLGQISYEEAAQHVLDGAVERARRLMPLSSVRPKLVEDGAAGALIEAASDASLLVVGSHGRGWLGSAMVGSVSQQCVTHAHPPVVVVPASWQANDHERIVVGVDGSQRSYEALDFAREEATRRHATLDVVHVWHQFEPIGPYAAQMWTYRSAAEKESRALLDSMTRPITPGSAASPGPAAIERTSIDGHPGRALASCAQHADLLVVGARGHGGFAGLLLGSVSHRCLQHTPCPIAVVH